MRDGGEVDHPTRDELVAAACWVDVDRVPHQPEMTRYRRQARYHQARWRAEQGHPIGTHPIAGGPGSRLLGSRLPLDYAKRTGANFLTPAVRRAVEHRLAHPQRWQTLAEDRLWADLLSSMPMCFNLFGDLHDDLARADTAVHRWWPSTPGRVAAVNFEWSPGRRQPDYLANQSAFDVAFVLDLPDGGHGVVGVETKYHEHAVVERPPPPERLARYLEVTDRSGVFTAGAGADLVGTPLQQLWLDHLLVLAMLRHPTGRWRSGQFVVVVPAGNLSIIGAADRYRQLLVDDATFRVTTLEELLEGVDDHRLRRQLHARYLWS